jgi:hypothetical protein
MNADQLLEHHTAQIDKTICGGAVQVAQRLLNAGADLDDLPRLMHPIIQQLARWRAGMVAMVKERTARMRVIEAQIERLESGATVH